MTKTPLASLAEEEWEALKAEEAVGGTVLFFFLLTRDKPFSSASMGLSTETNYCGLMGSAISSRETPPPENTPGSACVNASHQSARNPEV